MCARLCMAAPRPRLQVEVSVCAWWPLNVPLRTAELSVHPSSVGEQGQREGLAEGSPPPPRWSRVSFPSGHVAGVARRL